MATQRRKSFRRRLRRINDNRWTDGVKTYNLATAGPVGEVYVPTETANRLLEANASKKVTSVADLTNYIAGTTKQIVVVNDGDGTVTISLPQDIDPTSSPTFAGLTINGAIKGLNRVKQYFFAGF